MLKSRPKLTVPAHPVTMWVPHGNAEEPSQRWESTNDVKPWDFACEVSMPHYESLDTLGVVVALLRAQTIKPFISIIDCGSSRETCDKLEEMRAPDLEIHYHRFNGVRHLADFPATACDFAFSAARSETLVLMHTDVFLRRQDSLESLIVECTDKTPIVGFQMTPRGHPHWKFAVTHTFAAFRMKIIDGIGGGWSLRRAARYYGVEHSINSALGDYLDTETCMAWLMTENGIAPHFIGEEKNFEATVHPLIRHVRTLTGSRLYCPTKRRDAEKRLGEAMEEAVANLALWNHP